MSKRLTLKEYKMRIKVGDKIRTNANGGGICNEGETIEGEVIEIETGQEPLHGCFYISGKFNRKNGKSDSVPQWWVSLTNSSAWIEIQSERLEETYSCIIRDLRIGVENGL